MLQDLLRINLQATWRVIENNVVVYAFESAGGIVENEENGKSLIGEIHLREFVVKDMILMYSNGMKDIGEWAEKHVKGLNFNELVNYFIRKGLKAEEFAEFYSTNKNWSDLEEKLLAPVKWWYVCEVVHVSEEGRRPDIQKAYLHLDDHEKSFFVIGDWLEKVVLWAGVGGEKAALVARPNGVLDLYELFSLFNGTSG